MRSVGSLFRKGCAASQLALVVVAASCNGGVELPVANAWREAIGEERMIEEQPICVGSTVRSAGRLGETLFYRHSRLEDGSLAVGYYAFYSEERPWGNNWLTWSVLPALAVDLFYTRLLFVAPGLQRAAYGKGDVEGFRIVYATKDDGRIEAQGAVADDASHRRVALGRSALYSIDPSTPTVYSDVWSHQLGATGAKPRDIVYRRCYRTGAIRPLTAEIARDFNLSRRARPAAVGVIAPPAARHSGAVAVR